MARPTVVAVAAALALLLGAPALLLAQPHGHRAAFQVAPLDECRKLEQLSAAELFSLRDHSQLRQSKRRREMELNSFLNYKKNPTNDTRETAMWNSSRWGEPRRGWAGNGVHTASMWAAERSGRSVAARERRKAAAAACRGHAQRPRRPSKIAGAAGRSRTCSRSLTW
jgi:hypothetical protein